MSNTPRNALDYTPEEAEDDTRYNTPQFRFLVAFQVLVHQVGEKEARRVSKEFAGIDQ